MRKISAFIFDLDGVITDTSEFHYRAWQRLADEEGIPFSREDNEKLRGVSRRESLQLMLKGRVISEETAQAWMERKNNYYIDLVKTLNPDGVLPGVMPLLNDLKQAGIAAAIASSSKNAALVIERLALKPFFDAIVDGLMVTRSKPAPDLFLRAAQELSKSPDECVVVEDAGAGVEAGKAAGMLTIGLGPFERVGVADLVLPDLSHARLSEILARLQVV
jgi:beta-phosphoglucomutase